MVYQGEGSQRQQQVKYHGLVNQGATCYLNSVLQVLFMTEDFREKITSHCHTRNHAGKEHIESELRELFRALKENDADTKKITRKLRIENVYEQRDAAEHYEKILRLTSPEASQIFHGELINRTTCKQCNNETKSPAGFWHLPLPLVKNNNEYSVEKGIEDFFRSSEISGDDQMYCENCDEKCDAVLDCVVNCYPEVLVLLLKRFELKFEGNILRKVKINSPVKIPDMLHIAQNKIYKLYACVDHSGDLQWGHYIARIKSQDDGLWYIFNDLNVEESGYNYFQLDPTETSRDVYLLFYQKQKETAFTNMGRHDAPRVPPATPSTRTEDEHSFSEKMEDNKTHSKSSFNTKFPPKDQPVGPASKTNTGKISPRRENSNRHNNYDKNEAKRSRKDEFGEDKCHEKSQEIFNNYDATKRFQNNTGHVITDIPDETPVQTSKNKKTTHHNFNTMEDTKYKNPHVERTSNDENAKPLSGISTRVMGVDYTLYDGGPRSDKTKSPMLRQEEDFSVINSPSNAMWGKQHVIKRDPGLVQYRQDVQQYRDRNILHTQVQRSHSLSPSQNMHKNINPIGHSHVSNPEIPKGRRGGSLLRFEQNSDRQWPENETTLPAMLVGRHSFHGSHKPYYSQDVQLENFRKENMRNEWQMKNVRREPQNDSYKENIARLPQVAHNRPAVHEQFSRQHSYRAPRPNSGHGRSTSLGSRGKNYSRQNAKRNDSFSHITSPEEEITSDSLAVGVKNLSLNDSSKRQEESQDFILVREVTLETNVHQSRKRKYCWGWCECFLGPFKRRRTK